MAPKAATGAIAAPEGRTPDGRTPDGRTPDGRAPDGRAPEGRTPDGRTPAAGTRTVEITAILRDEILRGQYRPGERLPSERELASRFEVNRGAVREALKKLEQLGIASVHPGGVRVVPVEDATLEVLGHLMDLHPLPDPRLIGHLLEVMGALIAMSARTAVERAETGEVQRARELVAQIAAAASATERHAAWRELGDLFNRINGNLVLRLIANGLKTQFMGRLERIGIDVTLDEETTRRTLDELDQALSERNADAVAAAVQQHHNLVRQKILDEIEASRRTAENPGT